MPHSQFHFNCNNFGQLQKETNIKYIYAIYDRVRLSTGAKLHLEFAICRSLCVWVCAGVCAFVFFLFACCLFLSCKMHFTFYCALNQKSISVCRLCGLRGRTTVPARFTFIPEKYANTCESPDVELTSESWSPVPVPGSTGIGIQSLIIELKSRHHRRLLAILQ